MMQNGETAKSVKRHSFLSSWPLRNSLQTWRLTFSKKYKFQFIVLLGSSFLNSVNAQDKKTDSNKIQNWGPPESSPTYIIDGQKIKSESAPPYNHFLNQEYTDDFNRPQDFSDSSGPGYVYTGFKPLLFPQRPWYEWRINDSLLKKESLFYRKLFQENLFIFDDSASKFHATLDPLFNFQFSIDRSDSNKKYYQNTRGVLIQGNIGDKFAFSSIFWENQEDYPTYLKNFVNEYYVVPGNGRTKSFGTSGFDYSMSEAYLSFSPSSHFNFQGGYGKNFIGDGYRSLLLSDNSFAYPYIRITTNFWHIQYTNLYTEFIDPFADPAIVTNVEGLFQRKAGAFQYLSWDIIPQVEWGFFQGMIWTAGDQYNHMSFNVNYFDPVIGVNSLVYGLGNSTNVLLGSTLKYKITRNFMAYGQLVVGDFPQSGNMQSIYNQTGYQAGVKYYNQYGEVQLEYNQVRPYTYSNSDSLQSYSHYDQALGDPLGANFKELIAIVNLRYRHFSIHFQVNHALEGLDSTHTNYGNNIFLPLPNNNANVTMLQGIKSTLNYMDVHISYLLNPHTNMNLTIGVSRRTLTNSLNNQPAMTLFYFGFRTSIENMYVDF